MTMLVVMVVDTQKYPVPPIEMEFGVTERHYRLFDGTNGFCARYVFEKHKSFLNQIQHTLFKESRRF